MVLFVVILVLLGLCLLYGVLQARYKQTEYYGQTHNSYFRVLFDKGVQGEYLVWDSLQGVPGYKKILLNCYVPKNNGETTEIDVIFLHASGIYLLESKNYSGWIFGTETQQFWVQSLPGRYGQAHKIKFLNPIIQNHVHLKWLGNYLGVDPACLYSYIVFGDECVLKNITLTSRHHHVINRSSLSDSINAVIQSSHIHLTSKQIDALYSKLYSLAQVDATKKLIHIQEVQNKKNAARATHLFPADMRNKDSPVCPFCGGRLVLRTASKGAYAGRKFWGCSNYPKCRYIQNIQPTDDRPGQSVL